MGFPLAAQNKLCWGGRFRVCRILNSSGDVIITPMETASAGSHGGIQRGIEQQGNGANLAPPAGDNEGS